MAEGSRQFGPDRNNCFGVFFPAGKTDCESLQNSDWYGLANVICYHAWANANFVAVKWRLLGKESDSAL